SSAIKAPISSSRAAITSAHLSSTAAGVISPAAMRRARSSAESIGGFSSPYGCRRDVPDRACAIKAHTLLSPPAASAGGGDKHGSPVDRHQRSVAGRDRQRPALHAAADRLR